MTHPIPGYYRFIFAWADPVLALLGGALPALLAPDMLHEGFMPAELLPRDRRYDVIFHSLAGGYVTVAGSQAVLLHMYPREVPLWRALNAVLAAWDVCIVYGIGTSLAAQGRLADPLGTWRVGDWMNVVLTGAMLLSRLAMAFGVGVREEKGTAKGAAGRKRE